MLNENEAAPRSSAPPNCNTIGAGASRTSSPVLMSDVLSGVCPSKFGVSITYGPRPRIMHIPDARIQSESRGGAVNQPLPACRLTQKLPPRLDFHGYDHFLQIPYQKAEQTGSHNDHPPAGGIVRKSGRRLSRYEFHEQSRRHHANGVR